MEVITKFEINCGDDIRTALRFLDNEFYIARQKSYSPSHVFDENMSVKWNREEAARRNQEAVDAYRKARELKAESYTYLEEAIYTYIMNDSIYDRHFTRKEAEVIWQQTKNHHSDNPWDWVDEMADAMHEFIIARESKE